MRDWRKPIGVAIMISVARVALAADESTTTVATLSPPTPLIAIPQPAFDVLAGGFGWSTGVQFMSENIWRGISLTNHRPGALAYGELREGWFYLGGDVLNVTLPTSPAAQLDVYGGVRPAWGR